MALLQSALPDLLRRIDQSLPPSLSGVLVPDLLTRDPRTDPYVSAAAVLGLALALRAFARPKRRPKAANPEDEVFQVTFKPAARAVVPQDAGAASARARAPGRRGSLGNGSWSGMVSASRFNDIYKMGKMLGEGAFSTVKEGTHNETGETFAIKIVLKSELEEEIERALKDEISILRELDHPNVMQLHEVFDEPRHYFLVTELISGGELFDRIETKSCYNEKEARDVCKILIGALTYCHEQNVAHRDLKPENLLLLSDQTDTHIKLADFGFAKRVTSEACLTTQCGTPEFVAPELLEGHKYGTKADMWSIGVIVYILLGGYPPFTGEDEQELFHKICAGDFEFHGEYWGQISTDAKDLISALLTVDPAKRLSARQALKNPWIQRHDRALSVRNLGKNLDRFKTYNGKRHFKAAVKAVVAAAKMKISLRATMKVRAMSRILTKEELEDLHESFNMFDTDGGGTISEEELGEVMRKTGEDLTEEELKEMFKKIDINKDGEIDFEEYKVMMHSSVGGMDCKDKELVEAFKVFDVDGSGTTSRDELKEIMVKFGQKLTDGELDAVMKEVDIDGNGEIDFDEFCQMMK